MFNPPTLPLNLNQVVQDCYTRFVGECDILLLAPETFGELELYVNETGRMAVKYDWQETDLFSCRHTTICFYAWLNKCRLSVNNGDVELALRLMQFHVMLIAGCGENSRAINRVLTVALLEQELHAERVGHTVGLKRAAVVRRLLREL